METRRFEINISCASCANKIEKVFKKYPDIQFTINILEKLLSVKADESKYSDEFIEELALQAGYNATRI
ncbi:MAG: cation transporter [Mycoplasma sp.]|nr:cation transporter [Mycoplasma sp.]